MKQVFLLLFLCLPMSTSVLAQDEGTPGGGDLTPVMAVDGLLYKLNEESLTAKVANSNSWEGELVIPEHITYNGKAYTVDKMEWMAFYNCTALTRVRIPKTLVEIRHYAGFWQDYCNPFVGCTRLERIEVDEENPGMCSVDGVLFSKDRTCLYSYPAGARSERYAVPEGVTSLGSAFESNPYLVEVSMPNSVTHIASGIFCGCKSLQSVILSERITHIPAYCFNQCESLHFLDIPQSVSSFGESVFRWSPIKKLVIRGTFRSPDGSYLDGLREDTFYFMDDEVVIYVQPSEVEKFKKVFSGTVLPLNSYTSTSINGVQFRNTSFHDLQGRRVQQPTKGLYIIDGKKSVVR